MDECYSPPIFLSHEEEVDVYWEEPIFSDNSGKEVQVCLIFFLVSLFSFLCHRKERKIDSVSRSHTICIILFLYMNEWVPISNVILKMVSL